MTIDSIKISLDQLSDWWPTDQETATEQSDHADWLGWDGWVDVGASQSQASE